MLLIRASLIAALSLSSFASMAAEVIDVYRNESCGCCKAWIEHLEDNGFTVQDHVENDMSAIKQRLGVPYAMGSCHTGVYQGKFVEGHVPASDILALKQRNDLLGLAVPGMPLGSPGMEMGARKEAYDVVGLHKDGQSEVIQHYAGE
ncbi:DUF411 domain-containing protein [Atopomonas sediminilitoris]|uniref:DUF411 domain-containing protein n=1 Tax=Atopomonas sediminilitoris TaxID=2919919 RepID=UPI001F4ED014|nr:DUF411 domain-containing protein [Atopomonas sediminilitoris]MCJ8170135.1 DUF411 domain-containing protein [Atopomonas sediminilitoris]